MRGATEHFFGTLRQEEEDGDLERTVRAIKESARKRERLILVFSLQQTGQVVRLCQRVTDQVNGESERESQ